MLSGHIGKAACGVRLAGSVQQKEDFLFVCGKKLLVFIIVSDKIVLQAGGFMKVDAPCGENQYPTDELYKYEGNIRAGKKEHSKIQENIDSADCIVKIAEFPPPCSQKYKHKNLQHNNQQGEENP